MPNKLTFGINIGSKWTRTIMILIIINVSVFMLQLLFSTVSSQLSPQLVITTNDVQDGSALLKPWYYPASDKFTKLFWLYPPDALGRVWLWQFFTYMFLHSTTDAWHLIFNMLVLWMFGSEVERVLGRRRFLTLYFTAGIFAGVCGCIFTPGSPMIGASGAIFAIEIAFALYFPNSTVIFYFFPIKAKYLAMIFTGITIFSCIVSNSGNVAHFAHLGGIIYGFLFVRYSYRIFEYLRKRQIQHHEREIVKEKMLREKVDEILDKVNREGLQNLSWRERNFLKNASRKYKKNRN
ncbi:MAG TPA: rhomboid family intramembrane serine protease [Candidatus Wujingus californicus]|uniref:rhomboid family intramembrane serine protease n=1 Tax=Candidatus Wujingus californicus TaxID=3367618 RepID=UPI00402933BA